jgi:hypothetical protein
MNAILLVVLPLISALAITEALELLVSLFFGMRRSDELWTVGYVNLITNPLLNYFMMLEVQFHGIKIGMGGLLLLELLIVIAEWLLMLYALRKNPVRLFFQSLVMNGVSAIGGTWLLLWMTM